jgi:DNA polymerase III gamma/tau subunit
MIAGGLSADSLVAALVEHLRNLLILRTCGDGGSDLVEVPGLSPADLAKQAGKFDPVALTQDIAVLEELRRHMRQSQGGRALLDATLVRMTLAEQFTSVNELIGRLDGNAPTAPARPAGSGVAPRLPAQSPAQKKNEVATRANPPAEVQTPAEDDDDDLPRPGKVWEAGGPSLVEMLKQHEQAHPEPANVEPVAPSELDAVWQRFVNELKSYGPAWSSVLSQGTLVEIGDNVAVIRYAAQHETFVKRLEQNGKREMVREAMSKALQRPVGVTFQVDAPAADAPAPAKAAAPARRPAPAPAPREPDPVPVQRVTPEMVENLRATQPLVKALMDDLGAQVIKVEQS